MKGLFILVELIGFDGGGIEDLTVVDAVNILIGVVTINGHIQKMRRVEVVGVNLVAFNGEFGLLINRGGNRICPLQSQAGFGDLS